MMRDPSRWRDVKSSIEIAINTREIKAATCSESSRSLWGLGLASLGSLSRSLSLQVESPLNKPPVTIAYLCHLRHPHINLAVTLSILLRGNFQMYQNEAIRYLHPFLRPYALGGAHVQNDGPVLPAHLHL